MTADLGVVLHEHHALIHLLCEQARRAGMPAKAMHMETLARALAGHLSGMDAAFLPALRQVLGEHPTIAEARAALLGLSDQLARMIADGPAAYADGGTADALLRATGGVLAMERQTLLRTLLLAGDRATCEKVAEELEAHFVRYAGHDTLPGVPLAAPPPVDDPDGA